MPIDLDEFLIRDILIQILNKYQEKQKLGELISVKEAQDDLNQIRKIFSHIDTLPTYLLDANVLLELVKAQGLRDEDLLNRTIGSETEKIQHIGTFMKTLARSNYLENSSVYNFEVKDFENSYTPIKPSLEEKVSQKNQYETSVENRTFFVPEFNPSADFFSRLDRKIKGIIHEKPIKLDKFLDKVSPLEFSLLNKELRDTKEDENEMINIRSDSKVTQILIVRKNNSYYVCNPAIFLTSVTKSSFQMLSIPLKLKT